MLGILIVSIGGTQITGLLSGVVAPLRFILPPAAPLMNALMNADTLSGSSMLMPLFHVSLYIVILMVVYLYRTGKRDYSRI